MTSLISGMLDALSRTLRTSDNTLLLHSLVLLRMRPSSHVPPAASREPYRASSRSKVISQYAVEGELMRLCVFGLARYPCTGCIHDAAYLSIDGYKGLCRVPTQGTVWGESSS